MFSDLGLNQQPIEVFHGERFRANNNSDPPILHHPIFPRCISPIIRLLSLTGNNITRSIVICCLICNVRTINFIRSIHAYIEIHLFDFNRFSVSENASVGCLEFRLPRSFINLRIKKKRGKENESSKGFEEEKRKKRKRREEKWQREK